MQHQREEHIRSSVVANMLLQTEALLKLGEAKWRIHKRQVGSNGTSCGGIITEAGGIIDMTVVYNMPDSVFVTIHINFDYVDGVSVGVYSWTDDPFTIA